MKESTFLIAMNLLTTADILALAFLPLSTVEACIVYTLMVTTYAVTLKLTMR
jgi:hypothetical protein